MLRGAAAVLPRGRPAGLVLSTLLQVRPLIPGILAGVARPKQPLLSRERITRAATRIIDEQGLNALSLPALASDLGVAAPSLYHHFRDKGEILAEVARSIALSAPVPSLTDPTDWIEWMVELSNNFRKAVLRHRNAAPVFIEFLPRELLISAYDRSAQVMERAGVPAELHVLILDGCDRIALGSILIETARTGESHVPYGGFDEAMHKKLARAIEVYSLSADELFKQTVRSFLQGCMQLAAAHR
jgi:AcrR family transcriptional regulator